MKALPSKKKAVVAMDVARRRRRQPTGPDKPSPPSLNTLAFTVAVIIAAAATIFGLKVVSEFVQRGNYVAAVVAPFWVIVPGCAPLLFLIRKRRRAARAMRPPAVKLPDSKPVRKPRGGQNVVPLKRK
jgi:hypothetical protein